MAAHTKFFPAFHRHLFGRPPVGKARLLERKACEADQLCLTQLHTLFADVLPSWLPCYKAAQGANSRHRVYTPLVTFWAFLAQTLDADGSCRREWLDMVRRLNNATIGAPLDLAEFLFGGERNQWPGIRPVLRELQEGKCFYCKKPILNGQEDLDHFIPWSLYPNDLAHNFVLACRRCNNAKSDELSEGDALEQWIERNKSHGHRIEIEAASIGLPADANASARVAAWAYERVA